METMKVISAFDHRFGVPPKWATLPVVLDVRPHYVITFGLDVVNKFKQYEFERSFFCEHNQQFVTILKEV